MVTTMEYTSRTPDTTITWRGSSLATQILVLSGRALRPVFLDPLRVFFSLLQPVVLLLLFSQVFRSMADTPLFPKGVSYIDFLVPAILCTTATTIATQAGMGMTGELKNGVLARFRSMPMRPVSVLIARSVADLGRGVLELTVMLVLAMLVFGYSPAGGPLGAVGALLLALAIGWSLGWIFLATAIWMRGSESLQTLAMLVVVLLQFASSAYVPVEALPGYIQAVARVNPLSYGITASRDLALGNPVGSDLWITLLTCACIAVVAASLAVRGFKRPN
jgi:ABC-2 type transport system permease protein